MKMKYSLLIVLVFMLGCKCNDVDTGIGLGISAWLLWGHNDSPKIENLLHEDYGPMMARKSFDLKELEQKDYN